ncbi:hypothetical protein RRG08_004345 [Elysia crispata]|uniref:Uncharacterized protein n=1 Tax=Elysia crispata TaxID=231223 RepID=A0AAE1AZG8_9GAST|nr:hypothetical protein RRG08_004345 [Elysia crispata]
MISSLRCYQEFKSGYMRTCQPTTPTPSVPVSSPGLKPCSQFTLSGSVVGAPSPPSDRGPRVNWTPHSE